MEHVLSDTEMCLVSGVYIVLMSSRPLSFRLMSGSCSDDEDKQELIKGSTEVSLVCSTSTSSSSAIAVGRMYMCK